MFEHIKAGDKVIRIFAGMPMELTVVSIDDGLIHCKGGWMFRRDNGAEWDPEIGWGTNSTGSFLSNNAFGINEFTRSAEEP